MKLDIYHSLVGIGIMLEFLFLALLIIFWPFHAEPYTVEDYGTDLQGNVLVNWWVAVYQDTGDAVGDTIFIDADTTDTNGLYSLDIPTTNTYLLYAFPIWNDSTDTLLNRKQFMGTQRLIATSGDTIFAVFDGTVTGAIDSAASANKAYIADNFAVNKSLKARDIREWPKIQKEALPFCLSNDDFSTKAVRWAEIADSCGVPMTFYVITGRLDSSGTGSRADVCSTYAMNIGHEIGSHSHTHPRLDTLYNNWGYDYVWTELARSKTILDSLIRTDEDSSYSCKGFAWPLSAYNNAVKNMASNLYQYLRNGAHEDYCEDVSVLDRVDIFDYLLPVHSPAALHLVDQQYDCPITNAQLEENIDSLITHLSMKSVWAQDDTGFTGQELYKIYGQRSIGGLLTHGQRYNTTNANGDADTVVIKDSTFITLCDRLKYWEEQGEIVLMTYSDLTDWIKENLTAGPFFGIYGSANPRSYGTVNHQRYDTTNVDRAHWLTINNYDQYQPLKIVNYTGNGCIRLDQAGNAGPLPFVPYGLYVNQTEPGRGIYATTDASGGNTVVLTNDAAGPSHKALWVWSGEGGTSPSYSEFDGDVAFDSEVDFGDTLVFSLDTSSAQIIEYLKPALEVDTLEGPYGHLQKTVYFEDGFIYDPSEIFPEGPAPITVGGGGLHIETTDGNAIELDSTGLQMTIGDSIKWTPSGGPALTASASRIETSHEIKFPGGYIGDDDSTLSIDIEKDDALAIYARISGENNTAIFGSVVMENAYGVGVQGWALSTSDDFEAGSYATGIYGYSDYTGGVGQQPTTHYGGYCEARDGSTAVGIYAKAQNGIKSNWAGYFANGDVKIENDLDVDDDIIADSVSATFIGNITGNVTGKADSATYADTAGQWIGAATKVDTNKAYVYRSTLSYSDFTLAINTNYGEASYPWYSPSDTIVIARVQYTGHFVSGSFAWEMLILDTNGDTVSWSDTLSTASSYFRVVDNSPDNATITPAEGINIDINELSGSNSLIQPAIIIEFYYLNP